MIEKMSIKYKNDTKNIEVMNIDNDKIVLGTLGSGCYFRCYKFDEFDVYNLPIGSYLVIKEKDRIICCQSKEISKFKEEFF